MATQQWKYHVFISFRGEDTRLNFVCHLNDALRRTGLNTFVDNQLRRGEEINTALLQAIQDSKVALIIFSENYASSSWCLDELLKIIECCKNHDQIVIPVFYGVTPSDVRRQNGRYGESFAKHIENAWDSNKIQKWKDALTEAANISGWDSGVIRGDNKLIDKIVRVVLEKFGHLSPRSLEGFVGLKSKISQVKTLLATGSSDVCMLGIWGMGGIGKTTLAEAIFAEVSSQFKGHCIVPKVREAWEKGCQQRLLEQLISELLGQSEVKIDTPTIGPEPFLVDRLKSKKVLVVLDDVTDRSQLEYFIGNQCWFGAGSNIIITSRDKHVFAGMKDINIYEVEALSGTESHQLFVRDALKEKQPSQDHIPLIGSFVNYARGNPLAIKVLGSYVCGKGVKLWKDALNKLLKCPNQKIQNVLKLSYDGLDREEQAIFLHIACFFKGENIDEAKRIFSSCGLSADVGVSVLVDKSLVTSRCNNFDMHDLLQEMGREIVRQESNNPRRRSRLWDSEEIRRVFEENEGTEATEIESISLNTSQIQIEIELDPNVFKRMPNLKFLRCGEGSKLHLTRGLHFLPTGLRYLYWDEYPLDSLPTDFDAQELLVLHLPNSNIKQISKELKDRGKLEVVAQSLIGSPFISRVIDIVFDKLPFGIGKKVPSSSCRFLSKITRMDMEGCQNLRSFPNNVDLQCLEILNLMGCSNLTIFPKISTNLRELNVRCTAIKEVPSSSIEGLSRLENLDMMDCEKLESLPSNICKLQALQQLNLGSCSSFKKFPEISEPMYNLRNIDLSNSGIEVIPSLGNMNGLTSIHLAYFPETLDYLMGRIGHCELSTARKKRKGANQFYFDDLDSIAFSISPSFGSCPNFDTIVTIYIQAEKISQISRCNSYLIYLPSHPSLRSLSPYYTMKIWGCRKRKLLKDLGSLNYLRELKLQYNDFVEIPDSIKQLSLLESLQLNCCPKLRSLPDSIKQLSLLESLELNYCPKLRSLPQLPASLCQLSVACCESLKTLLAFKQPIFNGGKIRFYFDECFKLEEKEYEAMAYKLLLGNGPKDVSLRYPGGRIPEWFRHQTTRGIIREELPSNWFFKSKFFGFAFCVVSDYAPLTYEECVAFACNFEGNYNPTIRFTYQSHFAPHGFSLVWLATLPQEVLVWCSHEFNVWISEKRQLFHRHCINMASFKFFIPRCAKIKKFGITPLYKQVYEGYSGIAPLYMQVDEGYVQGDDDDQDDVHEKCLLDARIIVAEENVNQDENET